MTEIQLLPPQPAIDFAFGSNGNLACSNDDFSAAALALLTISTSPSTRSFHYSQPIATPLSPSALSEEALDGDEDTVSFFPNLPPLHHGQPSDHLRKGVSRAWEAADAHDADAERAFFVADLGEVMSQYERWRECLPDVEPFYGEPPYITPSQEALIRYFSRQVQSRSVCYSPPCRPRHRLRLRIAWRDLASP